mmetsp:Transcript_54985/g.118011  ORF Transcript_54985/g.118011 Transcript_54985/m.118011 type:complete len:206 (+) Transcript_54985:715-1332(+)
MLSHTQFVRLFRRSSISIPIGLITSARSVSGTSRSRLPSAGHGRSSNLVPPSWMGCSHAKGRMNFALSVARVSLRCSWRSLSAFAAILSPILGPPPPPAGRPGASRPPPCRKRCKSLRMRCISAARPPPASEPFTGGKDAAAAPTAAAAPATSWAAATPLLEPPTPPAPPPMPRPPPLSSSSMKTVRPGVRGGKTHIRSAWPYQW